MSKEHKAELSLCVTVPSPHGEMEGREHIPENQTRIVTP